MKEKFTSKNIAITIALIVVAILSITVISKYATSLDVHEGTLQTLDEKKVTAMELTAGVAATSTAISVVIPTSVNVTKLIENTFEESISQTYDTAEEITGEAEKSTEEKDNNGFMNFLKGIGDEVTGLAESAKNALSVFIDAIAVLIITTCVIPILVILFFLWLIKMLFGITINLPDRRLLGMKKR